MQETKKYWAFGDGRHHCPGCGAWFEDGIPYQSIPAEVVVDDWGQIDWLTSSAELVEGIDVCVECVECVARQVGAR